MCRAGVLGEEFAFPLPTSKWWAGQDDPTFGALCMQASLLTMRANARGSRTVQILSARGRVCENFQLESLAVATHPLQPHSHFRLRNGGQDRIRTCEG